ncbi:MAG: response regulator [Hyphomicrobiales bacterium]|nr:MAG: response regulator [Hyphomicrobiales bacterium]
MANILVAEDDGAVRDFVRRGLELHGHEVTAVADGGEAAQLLFCADRAFDLLLADIRMPVMDGIALALRAARDCPLMPVLLMTGYADQRERARELEAIIRGVLQKPFTLEQLAGAVTLALEPGEAGR